MDAPPCLPVTRETGLLAPKDPDEKDRGASSLARSVSYDEVAEFPGDSRVRSKVGRSRAGPRAGYAELGGGG